MQSPSSTADHTHAVASMMAIKMKKARLLSEAAHAHRLRSRALAQAPVKYGVWHADGQPGRPSTASAPRLRCSAPGRLAPFAKCTSGPTVAVVTGSRPRPRRPTDRHSGCAGPCPLGPVSRPARVRIHHSIIRSPWRGCGIWNGRLGDMPAIRPHGVQALKLGSPRAVVSDEFRGESETYQPVGHDHVRFPRPRYICRRQASSGGKRMRDGKRKSATG